MGRKKDDPSSLGFSSLARLWRDLRYGARTLIRNPGFATIAVVSLALGIGATTAIFSLFDALWLRPLPYQHRDRLVAVSEVELDTPDNQCGDRAGSRLCCDALSDQPAVLSEACRSVRFRSGLALAVRHRVRGLRCPGPAGCEGDPEYIAAV